MFYPLLKRNIGYIFLVNLLFLAASCSDDEEVTFSPISVSVSPNDILLQPGDKATFTVNISADAGNQVGLMINDGTQQLPISNAAIGSFDVEYTYPETASNDFTLTLTATDNSNSNAATNTATATALITYVKPATQIVDFTNLSNVGQQYIGDWWFDASTPGALFGSGADTVIVASRGSFSTDITEGGLWDFNATLPETTEKGIMMTREVLKEADPAKGDTASWGGYMIPVMRAGKPYDANEIASAVEGIRVVAVDVYYAEEDATHSFDVLSSFKTDHTDDTGAVKDKDGVKFQLRAINYDIWKQYPSWGGDPQKYFMMKEAYITEKNQWVTLYFTEDDAGEKAADLGTASGMSVSDIDAFWLIPNYGYPLIDRNKVYIKNFRITTLGF